MQVFTSSLSLDLFLHFPPGMCVFVIGLISSTGKSILAFSYNAVFQGWIGSR